MVLILAACMAAKAPVRATEPTPLAVLPIMESVDDGVVAAAPPTLVQALGAAVEARGLHADAVAVEPLLPGLAARRDTAGRVALADDGIPGPLLLVESKVGFYSQISGRYRWVVEVTATIAPDGPSSRFEVPVFLQHHHEVEDSALVEAAPVIARRVGTVVDTWVSSR
jgi:hypothetical protein